MENIMCDCPFQFCDHRYEGSDWYRLKLLKEEFGVKEEALAAEAEDEGAEE